MQPGEVKGAATQDERNAFWGQFTRSLLAPMLRDAGSYTPAEQADHLQFVEEHFAPLLGPLPTEPLPPGALPTSLVNAYFEASTCLTSYGRPTVRCVNDLLAPIGRPADDPFGEAKALQTLRHMASAAGADTRWMEHFRAKIALSPSETQAALSHIPPGTIIPPAMVGVDMDGPNRAMKAYFPAMRKAIATGQTSTDVVLDAFQGLEPLGSGFKPALATLTGYLSGCQNDCKIVFVSIDCVDPEVHPDARIKCYLHTASNAFDVVRDVMTLGGRLDDETTLEGIRRLRSIWPTLLNQPEGVDTDDSKHVPELVEGSFFSGLLYNVELRSGDPRLGTKIYIPVSQFAAGSAAFERNILAALTKLNMEWGTSGKYKRMMEHIFGEGVPYGQMYLSFAYSEKKGNYTVSYVSRPTGRNMLAATGINTGYQYI